MSGRQSDHPDSMRLIAATTILILTAQRYFQASRRTGRDLDNSTAPQPQCGSFPRQLLRPGHGRQYGNPLRIS
jgi:hypothetical protein